MKQLQRVLSMGQEEQAGTGRAGHFPGRGANRHAGVRAVSPGQQDVCPDTDCVNKGLFKNAHVPQAGIPSSLPS